MAAWILSFAIVPFLTGALLFSQTRPSSPGPTSVTVVAVPRNHPNALFGVVQILIKSTQKIPLDLALGFRIP